MSGTEAGFRINIATLRAHEQELRHRGVLHAALFGSLAHGGAAPATDIDILIELERDAPTDLFDYIGITHYWPISSRPGWT